ncbi:MAG: acyl transferase [Niabella sp.]
MSIDNELIQTIFSTKDFDFTDAAIKTFRFQYVNNELYRRYTNAIGVIPANVTQLHQVPFLPIRFFKTHRVTSTEFVPQAIFESSGTTSTINSLHHVKNLSVYETAFLTGFKKFYGDVKDWCIIGLLPSYLERENSSLVYMMNRLIQESHHSQSGFYLNEFDKLALLLKQLEQQQQKTMLLGVTFALLDFANLYPMPLCHTTIVETGGMKGRKKEMIRQEMHDILKKAFHVNAIHSEYGMTELLSQAYSKGDGFFETTPQMKILIRDNEDPLTIYMPYNAGAKGLINVIDLANIYSCSFIATDDLGWTDGAGRFGVTGRRDNSDLRGCSLLSANLQ